MTDPAPCWDGSPNWPGTAVGWPYSSARTTRSPTTRADLFFVLGHTYKTLGMDQRARELYEQALALRKEIGMETDQREIETSRLLASVLLQGDAEDLERAEMLYEKVRAWAAENGHTKEHISALSGLSSIEVTDISKDGYSFDPEHSVLTASRAAF